MRFKAKLTTEKVDYFHSLLAPMVKVCDSSNPSHSILYLDPTHVRIPLRHEQDGISTFAELSSKALFVESRIESQANNAIVMEMDLTHLKMALQSVLSSYNHKNTHIPNRYGNHGGGSSGTYRNNNNSIQPLDTANIRSAMAAAAARSSLVSLKLAKRNGVPCLCLDGTVASFVDLHHAIPVRIVRVAEANSVMPPQFGSLQLQLQIPPTLPLRNVIDKMKHMGKYVYLDGAMRGDLTIRMEHEGAAVRCFYNQLTPYVGESDQPPDLTTECTVKVDASKLAACLQWQSSPSNSIVSSCIIAMIEQEVLILHVFLMSSDTDFLTYYIPVQYINAEEGYE